MIKTKSGNLIAVTNPSFKDMNGNIVKEGQVLTVEDEYRLVNSNLGLGDNEPINLLVPPPPAGDPYGGFGMTEFFRRQGLSTYSSSLPPYIPPAPPDFVTNR